MSDQAAVGRPGPAARNRDSIIGRGPLFAGLSLIGFANGNCHRVIAALRDNGERAVLNTFDIGAMAWIALFMSVHMLARPAGRPASRRDLFVAGAAVLAFLVPAAPLTWLALTAVAVHVAITSPDRSSHRRGAWILLALTVPMFWSRALFALFSDGILQVDAVLASLLLGTSRLGNSIAFADGSGYVWIAPGCSSIANVSLAILCWVVVAQSLGRDRSGGVGYCLLACAAVVAINVGRLALIGVSRGYFEVIHGPTGNLIVGWLTFAVTLAVCLYGATREPRHVIGTSG